MYEENFGMEIISRVLWEWFLFLGEWFSFLTKAVDRRFGNYETLSVISLVFIWWKMYRERIDKWRNEQIIRKLQKRKDDLALKCTILGKYCKDWQTAFREKSLEKLDADRALQDLENSYRDKSDNLIRMIENLKTENRKLSEKNEILTSENAKLTEENTKLTEENTRLIRETQFQPEDGIRIRSCKSEIDTVNNMISKLETDVDEIFKDIDARFETFSEENKEVRLALANIVSRVSILEKNTSETFQRVKSVEAFLEVEEDK